jgi:hypothetical protein
MRGCNTVAAPKAAKRGLRDEAFGAGINEHRPGRLIFRGIMPGRLWIIAPVMLVELWAYCRGAWVGVLCGQGPPGAVEKVRPSVRRMPDMFGT